MRKYLMGLLTVAFVLSTTAAFAVVDATKFAGWRGPNKWFRLSCTVNLSRTFTVNVHNTAGTNLGEVDTIGSAGTATILAPVDNGPNVVTNMTDGTSNTHLRVHFQTSANNWQMHLVTDNTQTFLTGNDKGGLWRVGATSAAGNRIQVLWHGFVNPTPTTLLTNASTASAEGWRWIVDTNNDNWNATGLADSQIAWGWRNGGQINVGGTYTDFSGGTDFAINIAGIVDNVNEGSFEGNPTLVFRAL